MSALVDQELEDRDPARAVELCEILIGIHSGRDGPDAEITVTWRGYLGRALGESHLHDRAEDDLRRLVKDRTRVLGADHPATFVARGNLNRAVGFGGRTGEALKRAYKLLADRERVLGADEADTLRSRGTIARLLLTTPRSKPGAGRAAPRSGSLATGTRDHTARQAASLGTSLLHPVGRWQRCGAHGREAADFVDAFHSMPRVSSSQNPWPAAATMDENR